MLQRFNRLRGTRFGRGSGRQEKLTLVHTPWYAEAGKEYLRPRFMVLGAGVVLAIYLVGNRRTDRQKYYLDDNDDGDDDDNSGKAAQPFGRLFGAMRKAEDKHTVTFTSLESRLKTYKTSLNRVSVHQRKGRAFAAPAAAPATASAPAPSSAPVPAPSLAQPTHDAAAAKKGRVFVLDFHGDMMASQVAHLREEVTAVTLNADPAAGDQVILLLHSGGGTVTGYGLASAQLARIKSAGLPLTVCVDEVAASGGYMMAAVADKIVSSPFAVIGSIGVVALFPNVTGLLEKLGVEVDDVTAGEYKRTLVPYKRPSENAKRKVTEDVELTMKAFVAHIKEYRGKHLDVAKVATGETWMGSDALTLGLVDELGTSDEILIALLKTHRVFLVKHRLEKRGGIFGDIPLRGESEGWLSREGGESEGDSGILSGWMGSAGASLGQGFAKGFGRAVEVLVNSPRPPM